MTMKKIDGIVSVYGRRWFQKSYGNTYHSVKVVVNNEILYHDETYGYEDAYKQTAWEVLKKAGYEVPENYGDFIRMGNIDFNVEDVSRERDLKF